MRQEHARRAAEAVMEAGFAFMRHVRHQARGTTFEDLSLQELRFLGILAKEPERTLGDIAQDLCVTPAAITKLADGLAARGLLVRAPDPTDRRRVLAEPTASGRSLLQRAKARLLEGLQERLQGLPAGELDAMAAALATVRHRLAPPEVPA